MFSGGTWDKPSFGVAYALVLASNGTSEPFVCELVLSSRWELRTSWGYSVILHRDVTNEVPVRKLLEAACPGGGFDQLVQEQKLGLRRRLSSAGINSRSAVLCFQQTALAVWIGKLIDKAREIATNAHGPFPAWEYTFMQDHLSTQQSFALADCGLTDDGATVRYASPGFCDLFELNTSEIVVKRYCQHLIGYHVTLRNVATLTAQVGMDLQQVKDRLLFVSAFTLCEVKASVGSWDRPSSHLGFALAVCYKQKAGTFFVCELNVLVRTEPHTGWMYLASFHRSVAHEVPVRRLLEAACPGGGLEQLVQEQHSRKPTFLESIGIYSNSDSGRSRALHFLDERAFDTWTGMVKDALWWTPGLDLHPAQSRSRNPDRLPRWACALIQGGLSDQQSFTICDHDLTDEGLTVLYASPGFCDFFESDSSEFLGTRCCYQCDASQIAIAAQTLGMGIQEIEERLLFMHKYFVKQATEQVGFSLLLACKGSGTIFVCAVTLMSRTEQITGWQYTTLLQMDVTNEVANGKLLEAACPKGGFDQLVQDYHSGMLQRFESSGIRLFDAEPSFQQEALERWTGQLMDVVRRDRNRAAAKAPRAPPPSCGSDGSQVVQRSEEDTEVSFQLSNKVSPQQSSLTAAEYYQYS
ncbi:unnamed protein product [Polarella glacialis]|uniref:Uncharacterized protein n=1 Tax=Polarella glacialis TaxID=89957 RepID=A0A813F5C6_POLGL|nr:unnamed protein product [Polarella glacialis]